MDLVIETLTGTVFELRVSPFETIMSVKAKIQRLEGIPMSQQHLIWRSVELEDDYCLHDYNIQDGTTLKLVLAMRGGPINTRRVSLEDPTLREMAEYMEANRDDIWDTLMKDNRQVTLLVFRDGDQLNFFRVYDRGDGTLTPMSETLSATSMYNLYEEGEEVAEVSPEKEKENGETKAKMELLRQEMANMTIKRKEKEKENSETKAKMELLRSQMAKMNINKKKSVLKPRPPSTEKTNNNNLAKRRLKFSERVAIQRQKQNDLTEESTVSEVTPQEPQDGMKKSLPPVSLRRRVTSDIDISDIMAASNKDAQIIQDLNPSALQRELTRHDSSLDQTEANDTFKRKSSGSRKLSRRTHQPTKGITATKNVRRVAIDGNTPGEDDTDHGINNRGNESRFRNTSSSSKILRDLMCRSSVEDGDVRDLGRTRTEGTVSPKDPEEGRTLGQLLRGSKEYREYKALISWIRPNSDVKQPSPMRENSRVRFETENGRDSVGRVAGDFGGLSRGRRTPEELISTVPLAQRIPSNKRLTTGRDSGAYMLPPVSGKRRPPQLLPTSRKKARCTQCTKKLGLATSYQCRCGNQYCASHRYAESHNCTYDYKAEGKKVLEQSNPLVIAPKLPKI